MFTRKMNKKTTAKKANIALLSFSFLLFFFCVHIIPSFLPCLNQVDPFYHFGLLSSPELSILVIFFHSVPPVSSPTLFLSWFCFPVPFFSSLKKCSLFQHHFPLFTAGISNIILWKTVIERTSFGYGTRAVWIQILLQHSLVW